MIIDLMGGHKKLFRKPRTGKAKDLSREEIITQKLHKEALTSDDVIKLLFLSKDKFRPWIDRMCELYPDIDKNQFKEGKNFKFPPHLHSIFLVLLGNMDRHPDFIRNTVEAKNHSWDERIKYYKELKDSMQKFMTEEEIYEIKFRFPYIRSELEELLADSIRKNFSSISGLIQEMPDDLRFQILASINNTMEQTILSLSAELANYDNVNKWEGKDLSEEQQHQMHMEYSSFDSMCALHLKSLLEYKDEIQEEADKIAAKQEAEKYLDLISCKFDSDEEHAAINALFDRLVIEPWRNEINNEIKESIASARKAILSEPSNAELIKRVLQALDGVDQNKVDIIRKTMEKTLISLEIAERDNETFRAEAKKYLDKMLYDFVKEKFRKN